MTRATLLLLALGGCCINPTPPPPPPPVVPSEAPVRPGPSRFPDAGFRALVLDVAGEWSPLDSRVRMERGVQGGGHHLSLTYELGVAPPAELFVVSRVVRLRDGLIAGRDDTSLTGTSWRGDGGVFQSFGGSTVRLCPVRTDAGILGEALVLESYGYDGPFGERLVEALQPFRVECPGCEADCGG
ncbi:MAG: hypothetical protein SFW67_25065 [Myxococcaceae bacterium]|nr:hypothetical protein [Myxococcaceae bacterium]